MLQTGHYIMPSTIFIIQSLFLQKDLVFDFLLTYIFRLVEHHTTDSVCVCVSIGLLQR